MPSASVKDQAIITGPGHLAIDQGARDFLRFAFPARDRAERTNTEAEIVSISVPRKELRRRILADETFRRGFRQLSVQVQDLYVKRAWQFWGQGGLGERMSAKTYVSDVKALGQQRGSLLGRGLTHSIRGLQEKLESMAYWAQVVVIVGTISAGIGTAVYLAHYAKRVMEEYSEALSAAASSDAGLERAIQARAGGRKSPGQQPAPSSSDAADSTSPDGVLDSSSKPAVSPE